ncbi:MAG: hypothetical protein ABJN61_11640 [Flavobacteriaceae bacterium]|uniref:hypothetical protein n=1 Tax=Nonlabens ulvanivorans TaxID=906888 RepID=UPI0032971D7E
MRKYLFLALVLIVQNTFSQDLTCKDFKNGEFLILPNAYDLNTLRVTRQNGKQIETNESGNDLLVNIKYVDDCNYFLSYDPETEGFDDVSEMINKAGGLRISMTKIVGDTLYYKSVFKNDTINYVRNGRMVKLR